MCVFSLSCAAGKGGVTYYIHICGLYGCTTFSTLSNKWHDFLEKVILYKMGVLIFSTNLRPKYFILRRNQRDTVMNVHKFACKVPVIIVRF